MEETSKNNETAQLGIGAVNCSKLDRIVQTKKLIDEGKIFFDPINNERSKNFIIGVDFGSSKDESREHIFYCR